MRDYIGTKPVKVMIYRDTMEDKTMLNKLSIRLFSLLSKIVLGISWLLRKADIIEG